MDIHPNQNSRYAVYLIPPYSVTQTVAQIHTILRKQFGFIAADQFQVHCTLKGFFKKNGTPLSALEERLDEVFASQRPFPIHFNGYHIDNGGIGLNISLLQGEDNAELHDLRRRVVDATLPAIADNCDFAAKDLNPPFKAHITLAFRDITPAMHDDVLDYLHGVALPTRPFMAKNFHLLEFFSDDWTSDWEQTLTWRLLSTWRL